MRISDWSSDVCSSDLPALSGPVHLSICTRRTTSLRTSRALWTGIAVRLRARAELLLGRWSACDLYADVGVLYVTCAALQCVTRLLCGYSGEVPIGFYFPQAASSNLPFGAFTPN